MAAIIIKYQLADGVTREQFEEWVRTKDQPAMRSLSRVDSFETYRVSGKLIGEGDTSVQYVELFDVPDLAGFTGEDMPGDLVQGVMGEFMGLVKDPEFLIAEKV
ncbi:MAG: REDY-like protein HapK [Sphingomonadaceae bacterium]|jgi:hypothetical protein|nr:hypothetical protein [Sphingomonadaceae bacterium]MCB2086590.1 hypothetical protein [Sphingomonadaceae bacterium]MCP5390290.1 REDY-like protein HapK [Sphingomonadaceae bacterium]MCP5392378.1 REDY-like protein HapK [Sphingomonadaceae bacterium]